MIQYLIVILFFLAAVGVFVFGLHFSKYKKTDKAGCGDSCYCSKNDFVDKYGKGGGACKNKNKTNEPLIKTEEYSG